MSELTKLTRLFAIGVGIAYGKVLAGLGELSSDVSYDFIVVGGKFRTLSLSSMSDVWYRGTGWLCNC